MVNGVFLSVICYPSLYSEIQFKTNRKHRFCTSKPPEVKNSLTTHRNSIKSISDTVPNTQYHCRGPLFVRLARLSCNIYAASYANTALLKHNIKILLKLYQAVSCWAPARHVVCVKLCVARLACFRGRIDDPSSLQIGSGVGKVLVETSSSGTLKNGPVASY